MTDAALGEVVEIASGLVDPTIEPYASMPHVGSDNIESGTGRLTNVKCARELGLFSGKYLFGPTDVLYSKIRPALNKVLAPAMAGICSADIYPLRPRMDRIDRAFLSWELRSDGFLAHADRHSSRTSIPKLNRESLFAYQFRLPGLADQRRIADILDRADALRAKRRAALALLDTLAQSVFQVVTSGANEHAWPRVKFGDCMAEVYRYPTYYDTRYEVDGVPEIRGELLRSDGSIGSARRDLRFISRKTSERFPRTVLGAGDLVMSVRGTIGKVSIVPPELEGANITANLIRLAPNRKLLDPVFAWYLTQSDMFRHQLVGASSTTTIATIKAPDLKGIEVPLPSLAVQQQFAHRAAAVDRLKVAHRASLAQLDALFASLQHRAFRGEL